MEVPTEPVMATAHVRAVAAPGRGGRLCGWCWARGAADGVLLTPERPEGGASLREAHHCSVP